MAVTYDNNTSGIGGVASTSVTFSHTVGATANMLVVGAGERGTPSGVTYNGTSMTALGAFNNGVNNNGNLYYLANPTTGANNVVESHSIGYSTVGATSLIGASTTIGNYNTATGNSTTPSVTVTSTTNSIVVDHVIHNQGNALTVTGTNQTSRYAYTQANAVAGSTMLGTASTVPAWTCTGSNVWSMGAVSVDAGAVKNSNFLIFM